MLVDSEIYLLVCSDRPQSLVSKDLGTMEIFILPKDQINGFP